MTTFLVLLIIIDQLTKSAAKPFLQTQINSGSFLGIYIGKFPLFSLAISFLALVILLADLVRNKKIGIGEILILAGGIGNLVDRLFRPGVVDWINFYGLWFNIADIYITIGVIYFILITYYNSPRPRRVMS